MQRRRAAPAAQAPIDRHTLLRKSGQSRIRQQQSPFADAGQVVQWRFRQAAVEEAAEKEASVKARDAPSKDRPEF